jgi:hypothetical protein
VTPLTARVVETRIGRALDNTGGTSTGTGQIDPTAIAFVLISHGPNGHGAYVGLPTGALRDMPAIENARELGNYQELRESLPTSVSPEERRAYSFSRWSLSGGTAQYYDDIVRFMTQDQIMAYGGSQSCRLP